jgi:putative transposase
MDEYESLNHTQWDCKYHIVFIPKYRKKVLFGDIRRRLGEVFKRLAEQKESRIEEGHLMPDHVHMLISIPPKYSVAQVVGFIKGKSAIWTCPRPANTSDVGVSSRGGCSDAEEGGG